MFRGCAECGAWNVGGGCEQCTEARLTPRGVPGVEMACGGLFTPRARRLLFSRGFSHDPLNPPRTPADQPFPPPLPKEASRDGAFSVNAHIPPAMPMETLIPLSSATHFSSNLQNEPGFRTGREGTDFGGDAEAARLRSDALRVMGSDGADRDFGGEVSLESQVYWWHEKYKPRKPKYFNRVHTGGWQRLEPGCRPPFGGCWGGRWRGSVWGCGLATAGRFLGRG
eukprot:151572-Chlamydomonas_euryale.AAC.1